MLSVALARRSRRSSVRRLSSSARRSAVRAASEAVGSALPVVAVSRAFRRSSSRRSRSVRVAASSSAAIFWLLSRRASRACVSASAACTRSSGVEPERRVADLADDGRHRPRGLALGELVALGEHLLVADEGADRAVDRVELGGDVRRRLRRQIRALLLERLPLLGELDGEIGVRRRGRRLRSRRGRHAGELGSARLRRGGRSGRREREEERGAAHARARHGALPEEGARCARSGRQSSPAENARQPKRSQPISAAAIQNDQTSMRPR